MERDFSEFRPVRVWKRMTQEQRLAAAEPLRDQFVRHMLELAIEAATALDPEDPWELVDTYVAHVINYELDEADLYELLVQEGGPSVQGEEECIAILTAALEAGAETGTFAVVDAPPTARFLFHGVESLVRHHHRVGATDRERLISVAQRLVRQTLEPLANTLFDAAVREQHGDNQHPLPFANPLLHECAQFRRGGLANRRRRVVTHRQVVNAAERRLRVDAPGQARPDERRQQLDEVHGRAVPRIEV